MTIWLPRKWCGFGCGGALLAYSSTGSNLKENNMLQINKHNEIVIPTLGGHNQLDNLLEVFHDVRPVSTNCPESEYQGYGTLAFACSKMKQATDDTILPDCDDIGAIVF